MRASIVSTLRRQQRHAVIEHWYAVIDCQAFHCICVEAQVALLGDIAANLKGVGQLFQQKSALVTAVGTAVQNGEADDWAEAAINKSMAS